LPVSPTCLGVAQRRRIDFCSVILHFDF
jgi:hypothetical protein